MIHIKTKKGKGYEFAEKSDDKYHGVSKFDVSTGMQEKTTSTNPSFTKVFANTLIKHAEKDSKIVGITAAMPIWEQEWTFSVKNFLTEHSM